MCIRDSSYTAISVEDSTVQFVDKSAILDELSLRPTALRSYVSSLCDRYHQLCLNFERTAMTAAKDRVLRLLESLASPADQSVDLNGRLKGYSDDLNLSHEAVYRALHILQKDGAITRTNGIIRLNAGYALNHTNSERV